MNMDEDTWIVSACSLVPIAKQGLILVISKGSDKNMLVPNMPPDWQFIVLTQPDVKSHTLIFSTEQSSGLHCKMHDHQHCWALKDESTFKRKDHLLQQLAEDERGLWGCSRLCCFLPASYNSQGRGVAVFYLNRISYYLG